MKVTLKKAIIFGSVLLATKMFAVQDQINIQGLIGTGAIVAFEDASAKTINGFHFEGADIDLGTVTAGGTFPTTTKNIYVNTNHAAGVTIKIYNPTTTNGHLYLNGAVNTGKKVNMAYTLGGAGYNVSNASAPTVDLVTAANDGSSPVSTFVMTPSASAGTLPGGVHILFL